MMRSISRFCLMSGLVIANLGSTECAETVEFNRDIRPLLAENCYYCHGPDVSSRQANLRLDIPAATEGPSVIIPGQPEASPLLQRLLSDEPDERMPPPSSHKQLSPEQIQLVRDWI